MKNLYLEYSATENNSKWNNIISRTKPLYSSPNDTRTIFERDYNRIVHSRAYRRLKHKTQVFFSPNSDHVCTRIEHVSHVESISYTIAKYFGLNTELTKTIAIAHDLGHSPFGHAGEKILSSLSNEYLNFPFWHEQNGLFFVDNIELLEDYNGSFNNLNLSYAVRDGIISHCGEIDENGLKPRDEFIDLSTYSKPNQYSPYTWEACVVKIADKISYLGRDIEDALALGILDKNLDELFQLFNTKHINNTIIINYFISDLIKNSSLENGLTFSAEAFELMNILKKFNYENIYFSKKVCASKKFFELILTEIFHTLKSTFDENDFFSSINSLKNFYPKLYEDFQSFLYKYTNFNDRDLSKYKNKILFTEHTIEEFIIAIISYISGMTDKFAIDVYNEIIGF